MGYRHGSGGTDYTSFPEEPFIIMLENEAKLVEIPMTIMRKRPQPLERIARKLLRKRAEKIVWLRPKGKNLTDMIEILDVAIQNGRDYVQFMLHSSEFMPGGSPTFDTAEKIETLYSHLDELFASAVSRFAGIKLSDYAVARVGRDQIKNLPVKSWSSLGSA